MRRQALNSSNGGGSNFQLTVTMPAKAPNPADFSCKPGALQFFCMLTVDTDDNAPRICVWIPGLSESDHVIWFVTGSLSLGAFNVENKDDRGGAPGAFEGASLIGYSNANTDSGTITFKARVNGNDLPTLAVTFPPTCP